MTMLRLDEIYKEYGVGKLALPVLKGVSLAIESGEMVALMGASGSGKTTLINILGCLDQPTSGRYWLDDLEVSRLSVVERAAIRNQRIGFVFQSFNLLPRLTALENVMLPMSYSASHASGREVRARATALLERVGLGERLHHEPARLSGGEQQAGRDRPVPGQPGADPDRGRARRATSTRRPARRSSPSSAS